jgi:excisionase family DNA binding protein
MSGKRNLSTFKVAEMLSVDPGSVVNWIDNGLLKAHRTPGGHRRILAEDLVKFLRSHNMPLSPGSQAQPPRVVVVDDEPDVAQMISRAVRQDHPELEVLEARDGFQAGAIISTAKPEVVILDLRMPGIDGFEVCRMIKSNEATRHATVIAITAYPSPEAEEEILNSGARICLAKPLDLAELVRHVMQALGVQKA